MNFVALDFETANYKHTSICQIGITVFENGEIVDKQSLLVKPTPNYFENLHISIHGIRPEMVKDKPTFDECWNSISHYFEDREMIAHNASFDFSALRHTLNYFNIPFPKTTYYCSMLLSKRLLTGLINYQLPTVCKNFNIEFKHHDALNDAIAAGKLAIELCKSQNVSSLQELATVSNFKTGKLLENEYIPFSTKTQKKSNWNHKSIFENIEPQTTDFNNEHPFFEKNIVFTGALSNLNRADAMQMVVNVGGFIKPDNLTQKTNYLVVGNYDYNQYGEGFKSSKLQKAEQYIQKGLDIEIISENDFFKMVHSEKTKFEITLQQIEKDSNIFLKRNKYNDLSKKDVFFTSDLSIEKGRAFQMVGNCSGYGHDYDLSNETNYIVISNFTLEKLKQGTKTESVLKVEEMRNKAQNRGEAQGLKLIDETTFYEYMKRREQFQRKEIVMHINEWEVEEEYRIK
jgi:DNA polymerase III subunit epsilon